MLQSLVKDENAVLILECIILFALLYNYVNLQSPVRIPFSPDENSILSTSRELSEKGSFFWTSLLNQKYDVKFFRPRQYTEVAPNEYVTANSIGFALFLALASHLHILRVIVPLTAIVGILGAYGAVAEISGKRAGLFVATMIGVLPTYVFFSNTYMDIVPSVGFFLLSLFAFFKYLKSSKTWQVVLAPLFLAIAVFLRPYSLLFAVGYLVVIVLLRGRLHLKSLVVGVTSFLLLLTPTVLINLYAYGSPFRFGPTVTPENALELAASQSFTLDAFRDAFVNHVALLTPLLFLMGVFGIMILFRQIRSQAENAFLAHVGTISIISFAAFGALTRTYGFYEVTPVASVARYMMPVYVLLAFCAQVFVRRLYDVGLKRISMLMVAVLLLSLAAGSFAPNALPSLVITQQKYSQADMVIRTLPENAVVFTRTFDKLIFPIRNVAIVYTTSDLVQNPDLRFSVPIVDIDRDVIPVIQRLLHDGFHVYLAEDVDDLAEHLVHSGFVVVRINTTFGLREVFLGGQIP